MTVCHGDLTNKNVMLDESGRVYLIDWQTTFCGCLLIDLAFYLHYSIDLTESLETELLEWYHTCLVKEGCVVELTDIKRLYNRATVYAFLWYACGSGLILYFSKDQKDKAARFHRCLDKCLRLFESSRDELFGF